MNNKLKAQLIILGGVVMFILTALLIAAFICTVQSVCWNIGVVNLVEGANKSNLIHWAFVDLLIIIIWNIGNGFNIQITPTSSPFKKNQS